MNCAVDLKDIVPGFENPAADSGKTFRAILDAMARPGRVYRAGTTLSSQTGLDPATSAVALTLLDFETRVWTDLDEGAAARSWIAFHCGAPFVENVAEADFAVITRPEEMALLDSFRAGSEREPHLSATLVIQVEELLVGQGRSFSGPGIEAVHLLDPKGIADHFWEGRSLAAAMFPTGVDVVFTCNDRIAAMPRTTVWEKICT